MKRLSKILLCMTVIFTMSLCGFSVNAATAYAGGDLNGDAIVNNMDLKVLNSYLVGKYKMNADQYISADMNGDNVVNIFDAMLFRKKITEEFDQPVTLNTKSVEMGAVGEKYQMTASRAVTSWTSSNKAVASIGAKGMIIAISYGEATITATADNGTTASCEVVVRKPMSINRTSYVFNDIGSTVQLTSAVEVTWKSSSSYVATVNSAGLVTSKGVGSATITGTDSYGRTVSCSVYVNQKNYPIEEGTYTFMKNGTSYYMNISGASANNMANVQLNTRDFVSGSQFFTIKKASSGNYNLWTYTNGASVVDIYNWNTADNSYHQILGNQNVDICQQYSGYNDAQEFTFTRNWDSTYSIVSASYDAVAIGSLASSSGQNVQLTAYNSFDDSCKWFMKSMSTSISRPWYKYGYIKGGEVVCRESASSSANSKGVFVLGSRVKVTAEQSNGWYKVTGTIKSGATVTGYISSANIDYGVKKIDAKRKVQVVYLSPSKQTGNLYSYGGTNEAVQMRRVAAAAKTMLEANGVKVIVADQSTALSDRTYEAYENNAVAYVAIHSNASGSSSSVKGHGTLGFYYSGMDGSYNLAKNVYDYVASLTPNADNGMLDGESWGFYEILNTDMANTLVELEFHDNATDAKWIIDNADNLGGYVSCGILKYLYSIT